METTRLEIGDTLYAEGSWNVILAKIIFVDHQEAVSDNGLHFNRDFKDGDSLKNPLKGFQMDFNDWYLRK